MGLLLACPASTAWAQYSSTDAERDRGASEATAARDRLVEFARAQLLGGQPSSSAEVTLELLGELTTGPDETAPMLKAARALGPRALESRLSQLFPTLEFESVSTVADLHFGDIGLTRETFGLYLKPGVILFMGPDGWRLTELRELDLDHAVFFRAVPELARTRTVISGDEFAQLLAAAGKRGVEPPPTPLSGKVLTRDQPAYSPWALGVSLERGGSYADAAAAFRLRRGRRLSALDGVPQLSAVALLGFARTPVDAANTVRRAAVNYSAMLGLDLGVGWVRREASRLRPELYTGLSLRVMDLWLLPSSSGSDIYLGRVVGLGQLGIGFRASSGTSFSVRGFLGADQFVAQSGQLIAGFQLGMEWTIGRGGRRGY